MSTSSHCSLTCLAWRASLSSEHDYISRGSTRSRYSGTPPLRSSPGRPAPPRSCAMTSRPRAAVPPHRAGTRAWAAPTGWEVIRHAGSAGCRRLGSVTAHYASLFRHHRRHPFARIMFREPGTLIRSLPFFTRTRSCRVLISYQNARRSLMEPLGAASSARPGLGGASHPRQCRSRPTCPHVLP